MKKSHFKYIGIDPGKSGGITIIDSKNIKTYKTKQKNTI